MARPQKSPDDRASAAFRIRLTAAERQLLDEKAAAAGVTLSALIREAVLGYRLQPAPVWRETQYGVTVRAHLINSDWPQLRTAFIHL